MVKLFNVFRTLGKLFKLICFVLENSVILKNLNPQKLHGKFLLLNFTIDNLILILKTSP